MFLEPTIPCFTQPHSPQSQNTNNCCIKKSEPSKCLFIFSHIETYIKYLPHVEEISEAEFMVTALNASKRGAARSLGGRTTLSCSPSRGRLGSARLGRPRGGRPERCLLDYSFNLPEYKKKKMQKKKMQKKNNKKRKQPSSMLSQLLPALSPLSEQRQHRQGQCDGQGCRGGAQPLTAVHGTPPVGFHHRGFAGDAVGLGLRGAGVCAAATAAGAAAFIACNATTERITASRHFYVCIFVCVCVHWNVSNCSLES